MAIDTLKLDNEDSTGDKLGDPLVFLSAITAGYDPREVSKIHELVNEIDNFSSGSPSKSDWEEVVDHVNQYHKYKAVTVAESLNASKALAEYLHPKRKQVENIDKSNGNQAHNDPLSEDEILTFKEVFNDEF
jgi:hypothetical protein